MKALITFAFTFFTTCAFAEEVKEEITSKQTESPWSLGFNPLALPFGVTEIQIGYFINPQVRLNFMPGIFYAYYDDDKDKSYGTFATVSTTIFFSNAKENKNASGLFIEPGLFTSHSTDTNKSSAWDHLYAGQVLLGYEAVFESGVFLNGAIGAMGGYARYGNGDLFHWNTAFAAPTASTALGMRF